MNHPSANSFRGPPLHLLVFAYKRRLTGSVVADDGRREHILHFEGGAPSKVATDEHIAPLLDVLERLGLMDPDAVELERGTSMAPEDGRALVERGLIAADDLMTARRWQVMRKLEHVLNRPATTRYLVHEGEDRAEVAGEIDAAPVDPLAVIMQGSRLMSSQEVVNANVKRYLPLRLCMRRRSKHARLRLTPHEEAVVEALREVPRTLAELVEMGHDDETARRVIFGLIVAQSLARAPGATDDDASPEVPSASEAGAPASSPRQPPPSGAPPPAPFSVPPVSIVPAAPSRPPLVASPPSAHPWPMDREPEPTLREASGPPSGSDPPAEAEADLHGRPTPKRPPPVPNAQRFAFASRALRPGKIPVIESGSVEVPSQPPGGAPSDAPTAPSDAPTAPSDAPTAPSSSPPSSSATEAEGSTAPGPTGTERPLDSTPPPALGRFGTEPAPPMSEPSPDSQPPESDPPATHRIEDADRLLAGAAGSGEAPADLPPRLDEAASTLVRPPSFPPEPSEQERGAEVPPPPPRPDERPVSAPSPEPVAPAAEPISSPPPSDSARPTMPGSVPPSSPPVSSEAPAPALLPAERPSPRPPPRAAPVSAEPPSAEPPSPRPPPPAAPPSAEPPSAEPPSPRPPPRAAPPAAPVSAPPSVPSAPTGLGSVEVEPRIRDMAMRRFRDAERALKVLDRERAEAEIRKAMNMIPGEARFEVLALWIEAEKLGLPASDLHAKGRHYAKQLAALDAIVERAPQLEEAYYIRGRLLKRSGRRKDAIADFRRAVELNPANLDAAREVREYDQRRRRGKSKKGSEGGKPKVPKARSSLKSEAQHTVSEMADFVKGVLRRGRD